MEYRTASGGTVPMEWEWQGGASGPGDVTSPFYQIGIQHQQDNKKRTHSAFDSPGKKQLPALRPPNPQSSFLFSPQRQQSAMPSNSSVFGQPAFTTPRKPELDFSSGAENLSSPDNADNEDTPEQSSKSTRRNSLFNIYGRFAPSPGRGEIPRTNHYTNAVARRVQKKRRRVKALGRRMQMEDYDDESDGPSSREGRSDRTGTQDRTSATQNAPSKMSSFRQMLSILEEHPNVPAILSWWAQLLVNLSLFSLAVWMVFAFVSEIRREFDAVASKEMDTILGEIARCHQDYLDNKCSSENLVPDLKRSCAIYQVCMDQDPTHVGRVKLSAHTMAQIINSFIDPISWKAITFFLATIGTMVLANNWSFRYFRNHQQHGQSYPQHSYPPPPSAYDPNLHGQPLHLQQNPAYSYYGQQDPRASPAKGFADKQEQPLMLENTRPMDFVTERSREREVHPRTPSPSKRMHRQFA
ncbi:uncharacterized protein N7482_009142 [Penicillium canariense]|uniref:Brl1/Brr6 domain-containing protein n=1 Tax=Penicillium canariense TaxID=189055 RepID=A0A9W9LFF4_9EURO|nr:uncharacterized protein N7482_009142 [Penicillium canariense]KAJ5152664.1 hypothetical protein N7482_009142 [Penicillium canariense]